MTRSKKTPSVHKPPFDEESTLRFAEMAPGSTSGTPGTGKSYEITQKKGETPAGKGPQPDRQPITLLLKADTITTLQHEAGRRGKAIDQIVDKLVTKHLAKQK
jgi:hypothetical protein